MKDIIELLENAAHPKIVFCGDYEQMKDQAIDEMRLTIYQAIEMLKCKDIDPVKEDVERIEIEDICFADQVVHTQIYCQTDDIRRYELGKKPPMKMILEIPKEA